MKRLFAILFLSLSLSVLAHADDNSLIVEANAAFARKDYNAAFSKFSIVAQHGNAAAQYNLGSFYFNGQGVQKDYKQAFDWYQKAALQGKANAQYMLGLMYQNGLGIPKDDRQAIEWYQKSAVQGNENAKNALGKMHQPAASAVLLPARPQPGASPQAAAGPVAAPAVQPRAGSPETTASLQKSGKSPSSGFFLGLTLGSTGKLTGINNSASFGLLAGYKINQSFGFELAYNSLYSNANADELASTVTPGTSASFDLHAVSLAGLYTYPLTGELSLLGSLGLHSSGFNLKSADVTLNSGTSTGWLAGLKLQYDISRTIGIRGGFDTYTESGGMTGNISEFGVGAIYKF